MKVSGHKRKKRKKKKNEKEKEKEENNDGEEEDEDEDEDEDEEDAPWPLWKRLMAALALRICARQAVRLVPSGGSQVSVCGYPPNALPLFFFRVLRALSTAEPELTCFAQVACNHSSQSAIPWDGLLALRC